MSAPNSPSCDFTAASRLLAGGFVEPHRHHTARSALVVLLADAVEVADLRAAVELQPQIDLARGFAFLET